LHVKSEGAQNAARSALQPQGLRGQHGFFWAESAVEKVIQERDQNFAGKPAETPGDAKWMVAQSSHP
jgi:hypothetical protein